MAIGDHLFEARAATASADGEASPAPSPWDQFNQAMEERVSKRADESNAERSRLMGIAPDGQTLHIFTRLPSLDWQYTALNVNSLIELATALVLVRDDPSLLGIFH